MLFQAQSVRRSQLPNKLIRHCRQTTQVHHRSALVSPNDPGNIVDRHASAQKGEADAVELSLLVLTTNTTAAATGGEE